MEQEGIKVILYDEACNLCDRTVTFIKKRDKSGIFSFVPLQSPVGKDMLTIFNLAGSEMDTVIYIDNCVPYLKSTAGLKLFKEIGWPWKLLYGLIVIPKPIRDFIYTIISKSRYKLFGVKHHCQVDAKQLSSETHQA